MNTAIEERTPDAVVGQLVDELAGSLGVLLVALGTRAGLWKELAGAGPVTAAELAGRTGVAEPLVREWCRAQAAGGYLTYQPEGGTFLLPDGVAGALLHGPGLAMVDACTDMFRSMGAGFDEFAAAFAAGRGFGWHRHDALFWHGSDALTRVALPPELIGAALDQLGSVTATLAAGGSVIDIGAGYGTPTLAVAGHFPAARVLGIDYHEASVVQARKTAAEAGVADRVRFEVGTATDLPGSGYTLVTFFDSLHDLGDPVGALVQARTVLAPDGAVMLVEPLAADRVEDNLTPSGRMFYAVSTLICTPNAVSQTAGTGGPAPLGTQAGEALLRETAAAAGFTHVRRVPVDAPLNLVLELRP
jgi:2-polyprenyl-3-methyl-5-hydroxy-6-metoxy-1,4-benzoquinol methylase